MDDDLKALQAMGQHEIDAAHKRMAERIAQGYAMVFLALLVAVHLIVSSPKAATFWALAALACGYVTWRAVAEGMKAVVWATSLAGVGCGLVSVAYLLVR